MVYCSAMPSRPFVRLSGEQEREQATRELLDWTNTACKRQSEVLYLRALARALVCEWWRVGAKNKVDEVN